LERTDDLPDMFFRELPFCLPHTKLFFSSLTTMSAKEPGLGELSEFVSDHFFGDKHLIEHFSVMDEERMPDELRHDGAGASPSLDWLFPTDGFQLLDLSVQFRGNERTFLD